MRSTRRKMMGAHMCSCLVWMENEVAEKEILAQQGGQGNITSNPTAALSTTGGNDGGNFAHRSRR